MTGKPYSHDCSDWDSFNFKINETRVSAPASVAFSFLLRLEWFTEHGADHKIKKSLEIIAWKPVAFLAERLFCLA